MGDEATHLDQANCNQVVLTSLLASPDRSPEWIATVAFYKALHVVEAVFDQSEPEATRHSQDHRQRNDLLVAHYPEIWLHYKLLYEASLFARYLEYGRGRRLRRLTSFADYRDESQVIAMLRRNLVGVEVEADRYLSAGYRLVNYEP